jgi:hypothetical protein
MERVGKVTMNRWGRCRAWAALVAVGAAGLVACGDGSVGVARPFPIELRELAPGEVHVSLPSSVGSGLVSLRVKNSGTSRHDAQLVRVTGDRDREDVIAYFRSASEPNAGIPTWIRDGGGARAIRPGETVVVQQRLAEGDWFLVDLEYLEQGGVVPFTVTSGGSPGELPGAESRIIANDYSFTPRALRPGRHRVRFENRGQQMHEAVALPVVAGKTFEDVKAYLTGPTPAAGATGAPVDMAGAVTLPLIDRRVRLVTDLRLTPGTWVLACFVSDRIGGLPHVAKGMLAEIKVG